jgi:hypothetical protein
MKCDFKVAAQEKSMVIAAPEGRVLSGRMLRIMVANMETRYQVYEYSLVKGSRNAEEVEDLVGMVPLSGVGQKYIVFQRLHPSFYDENAIHLTPEEIDTFRGALEEDEEFVMADYTVSMPSDYFLLITDDIRKFITVATHLRLESLEAMQEAAVRLGEAAVSIYDEADMMIEYQDNTFPDVFINGLDGFLKPAVQVTTLKG